MSWGDGAPEAEILFQVFEKIGALKEKLEALVRAKADRGDVQEVRALIADIDRAKADRNELLLLKEAIGQEMRGELAAVAGRLHDRMDTLNSALLELTDKTQTSLGQAARMRELSEDISSQITQLGGQIAAIRESAEAAEAAQRRKWKKTLSATFTWTYRAFAFLAFLIILAVQGVTGLPQALNALRAATGF